MTNLNENMSPFSRPCTLTTHFLCGCAMLSCRSVVQSCSAQGQETRGALIGPRQTAVLWPSSRSPRSGQARRNQAAVPKPAVTEAFNAATASCIPSRAEAVRERGELGGSVDCPRLLQKERAHQGQCNPGKRLDNCQQRVPPNGSS